jgi:hypothetical protein
MDLEFVKRGQDKKKGYKIAPNWPWTQIASNLVVFLSLKKTKFISLII